jgi:hypothetical protein
MEPTPEQNLETTPIEENLLEEYRWKTSVPVPWEAGNQYYLYFPHDDFYNAENVEISAKIAKSLESFLRNYNYLSLYTGMKRTYARVKDNLVGLGIEPSEAWIRASLIGYIINANLQETSIGFSYIYRAEVLQANAFKVEYPFSSLHGWAIAEAADYMIHDILPTMVDLGGTPFTDIAVLRADVETVLGFFGPFKSAFTGEYNPYTSASDLQSLEEQLAKK